MELMLVDGAQELVHKNANVSILAGRGGVDVTVHIDPMRDTFYDEDGKIHNHADDIILSVSEDGRVSLNHQPLSLTQVSLARINPQHILQLGRQLSGGVPLNDQHIEELIEAALQAYRYSMDPAKI